jgi:hypothetical protein
MICGKIYKVPEMSCQVLFHNILNDWREIGITCRQNEKSDIAGTS